MTLSLHAVTSTAREWWGWLCRAMWPATDEAPVLDDDCSDEIVVDEIIEQALVEQLSMPPSVELPSLHREVKTPRGVEEPHSTRWHLRGQILDRLDEYFFCIRRVRRFDPHAYGLFSQIGFAVPADVWADPDCDAYRTMTPSTTFGGCLMARGDDDMVTPSFVYFEKLAHPSRVQHFADGPIYRLTCVYDNRKRVPLWRSDLTALASCHIGVNATTGAMTLLREATSTRHPITTGRRDGRRHDTVWMTVQAWAIPEWLLYGAFDHPEYTPEEWATGLLRMVFHTYASVIEKIVIRVKREGCCASFGLDVARAKVFFRDRTTTALAADGKRKRIFHAVRQHIRQMVSGTSIVRFHYRGLRTFDWNGYGVHIVWPKTSSVLTFPAPASYEEDLDEVTRAKYVPGEVVGRKFAEVLDR